MSLAPLLSSGKDDWATPFERWARLHARLGFTVDAAAHRSNALLLRWYGPGGEREDALGAPWDAREVYWCNPPYSRAAQPERFVEAAAGVTSVVLLPARTDTRLFHTYLWDASRGVPRPGVALRFLQGRVRFVGATAGAPFPSLLAGFGGVSYDDLLVF